MPVDPYSGNPQLQQKFIYKKFESQDMDSDEYKEILKKEIEQFRGNAARKLPPNPVGNVCEEGILLQDRNVEPDTVKRENEGYNAKKDEVSEEAKKIEEQKEKQKEEGSNNTFGL